jgi:site-specific DNA-methyltransferase (cytosine-N4-specific)
MPSWFPNFWIRFVTNPGDLVVDPFGGSLTTMAECEKLGRHCITSDHCMEYLQGGSYRIRDAKGISVSFPSK